MKRGFFPSQFLFLLFTSAAWLFLSLPAFAQETAAPEPPQIPPEPQKPAMLDTTGRLKLAFGAGYGAGFESVRVGETTSGEKVELSGGGGLGLTLGIGYGLSRHYDLDIDFGRQESTLIPQVSHAEGSFTRSFLLATIRKKFPISKTGQFKAGAGVGMYSGGELDLDWSGAQGNHGVINYGNALGIHFTGEFEQFIAAKSAVHIGARLYVVQYKADSYTIDGAATPVDQLKGNVKELNGSGIDAVVGISRYF